MEKEKLADIVLKSVEGAKRIADGRSGMIVAGSDSIIRVRTEEARNMQGYGPLAKFMDNSLKSLSGKERKTCAPYADGKPPNVSRYVAKASGYLNEISNFYNTDGSKEILLRDIKQHLVENYKPEFETAYSSQIKAEKSLSRMRNIGIAATALSFLGLYAAPCLPIAAIALGIAAGTGIVQKSILSTRKALKEAKKEMAKEDKLYHEIEGVTLNELEAALLAKESEIKRYFLGKAYK